MNIQELLNNPIISGGAILSVAGGMLYTLKGLPAKIISRIKRQYLHTVRIYDYDDLFDIIERWMYQHYGKSYKDVEARLNSWQYNEAPPNIKGSKGPRIRFKQEPTMFILRINGKRLLFSTIKEKVEHAETSLKRYSSSYSITGLLARDHIKAFLEEITNQYYESIANNDLSVFYNSQYGEWHKASSIRIKPIDRIILDPYVKNLIVDDLERFKNSKEWYFDTCIPYKRTHIYYGPPGTGKTSIALSIASHLKCDIYVMNVRSYKDDATMQRGFKEIPENAVLLIEDVDSSFDNRTSKNEGISFSCFINCLDGAFYKEGLLTCITTNHLNKLDPAMIRPGRIDLTIEIPNPRDKEISAFMTMFYKKPVSFISDNATCLSMSAIQEACISNRDDSDEAQNNIHSLIREKTQLQCEQQTLMLTN